ncbi:uncharacterized protein E0L32_005055 [Thyridium curvatum]|uniref:Uncharacterized protein n=1 Tax=Thyridium curvatum TaxID=1093900 RepID=A0A507B737_9PEZI|nr:uncharacterized protein E0L32_005055 [Thyridium curvatum]TPX14946.1 hypothetical protein E0L32_005055 [Thyridium curvatum]
MAAPGPAAARLRRYVYTGAFAAITIAGTIYGAGLKTQQEVKVTRPLNSGSTHPCTQERQKIVEATAEDKIAMLEDRKKALILQKAPLDRKLEALRERMRANSSDSDSDSDSSGSGR